MEKLSALFLSLTIFLSSFFGGGFDYGRSVSLSANDLSRAGYALTELLVDNCYNIFKHKAGKAVGDSGTTTVWPMASFAEALSDAYRLYPGSLKLRAVFSDALKNGFGRYLTPEDKLVTPSAEFDGISYYNS